MLVANVSTIPKTSRRTSTPTACRRGRCDGASSIKVRTPAIASGTPRHAPSSERSHASISSSRATLPRLAPSAARTACSRVRETDRPSVRQATLPQAMSRTHATPPNTASSTGRVVPTMSFASGTAVVRQPGVRVRPPLLVQTREAIQLGVRLRDRDAGGKTGDRVQKPGASARTRRIEAQRNPEIRRLAVRQRSLPPADVLEPGGHHADDDERAARQVHGPPDDRRIRIKPRAPDPLAQDDAIDAGCSSSRENVRPSATRAPSNSKYPAVTNRPSRFSGPADPRNSWPSRKNPATPAKSCGCSRKARSPPAEAAARRARVLREHANQPLGVRVWQWLQQHAADDAVDRGGAADGEPEGQGDDSREGRLLHEPARGPRVLAPDLRYPFTRIMTRVEAMSIGRHGAGSSYFRDTSRFPVSTRRGRRCCAALITMCYTACCDETYERPRRQGPTTVASSVRAS